MPSSPLAPLAEHLAAVEAALEAGDPLAAAEAVEAGVRACTELERGVTLDPAEVSRLAACQQRLLERAVQARDALAEQLRAAGQSRRATAAYGRR
jgi:hypothetical protein